MLKTRIIKLTCSKTGAILYSPQYHSLFLGWCDIMNHVVDHDKSVSIDSNYKVKIDSIKKETQQLRTHLEEAKQDIYSYCRKHNYKKTKLTISEVIAVSKF